jgi:hypothetical protein
VALIPILINLSNRPDHQVYYTDPSLPFGPDPSVYPDLIPSLPALIPSVYYPTTNRIYQFVLIPLSSVYPVLIPLSFCHGPSVYYLSTT